MDLIQVIEKLLIPEDDFIVGFADLHGMLDSKFNGFPYGISIGKRLNDSIVDNNRNGPTLEYFDHYRHINRELADLSLKVQAGLTGIGINSLPIEPTINIGSKGYEHYLKKLSFDISHKMVATRAGLGWIGKTALFVSEKFGPRLRLVSILIDRDPGIQAIPVEISRCGKCSLCVEACPAKAANGKLWNITVHRDEFFNAFVCRKKCGELAKQRLNINEKICGLCVAVCPVGKKFRK